jgi:hypothetical protein
MVPISTSYKIVAVVLGGFAVVGIVTVIIGLFTGVDTVPGATLTRIGSTVCLLAAVLTVTLIALTRRKRHSPPQ